MKKKIIVLLCSYTSSKSVVIAVERDTGLTLGLTTKPFLRNGLIYTFPSKKLLNINLSRISVKIKTVIRNSKILLNKEILVNCYKSRSTNDIPRWGICGASNCQLFTIVINRDTLFLTKALTKGLLKFGIILLNLGSQKRVVCGQTREDHFFYRTAPED